MKLHSKVKVINKYKSPRELEDDLHNIINTVKGMGYKKEDVEMLEINLRMNFPFYIRRQLQELFVDNFAKKIPVRAAHYISRDQFSPDPSLLSRLAIRIVTLSRPISVIVASNTLIFLFNKQFIWGHQIINPSLLNKRLDKSIISVDLTEP